MLVRKTFTLERCDHINLGTAISHYASEDETAISIRITYEDDTYMIVDGTFSARACVYYPGEPFDIGHGV